MEDREMAISELKDTAYEYYEDFYEEPRKIHYFELAQQVGVDNLRVLDYIAEALDLGCTDKENDVDKRDRKELFDRIGEPDDDRWDLIKE